MGKTRTAVYGKTIACYIYFFNVPISFSPSGQVYFRRVRSNIHGDRRCRFRANKCHGRRAATAASFVAGDVQQHDRKTVLQALDTFAADTAVVFCFPVYFSLFSLLFAQVDRHESPTHVTCWLVT